MPQPALELIDVLKPAYGPCPEFCRSCSGVARWKPEEGHVPRGYLGATGGIDEVEVIILLAEPANPFPDATFPSDAGAFEIIEGASANTKEKYERRTKPFHSNMRRILDLLMPEMSFDEQLRKTWIAETYLCSKQRKNVPAQSERRCASRYLARQLCLFRSCPVVALGDHAQRRVQRLTDDLPDLAGRLIPAQHPSARDPESAQSSWRHAAERFHNAKPD